MDNVATNLLANAPGCRRDRSRLSESNMQIVVEDLLTRQKCNRAFGHCKVTFAQGRTRSLEVALW